MSHKKDNTTKNCRCPQLSIEVIEYDGYVHNFAVEDDESYVAEGIAVHNCRCPEHFEYDVNPAVKEAKQ